MSVYWLITAQDQLQDALAHLGYPSGSLQQHQNDLSTMLQETFAKAGAIIVIERINGYSKTKKNHVLRVEHIDEAGEN
jgi:hypothetical protein